MWNINNLKRKWNDICRREEGMVIKEKTAEEIGKKGGGDEAEIKVFRHHYKDCSPEYRALYNEYKAAYVKARRLKNLEAERERMREYMVKYRERKYQERKQQMSLSHK